MKMFKVFAAVAAAGVLAVAHAPAQAATISLSGGTAGIIPDAGQTNEVLGGLGLGSSLAGFFGAAVNVIGSSPILVEFLGYEAGYWNTFSLDGGSFSTEVDDPTAGDNMEVFATPPSFVTGDLSGLLDFLFATSGGGSPSSVANGANPDDFGDGPTGVNFFASIVGNPAGTSGSSVLLFFDDNGRNNDDNHDDMVVRLSVAAIPVPATLPLMFGALAGLGFIGRRQLRAA
jgi:hypothetical protein